MKLVGTRVIFFVFAPDTFFLHAYWKTQQKGAINSVLGAFTTTFGTYIIPLVAYNLAFSTPNIEQTMVKRPPFMDYITMSQLRTINWFLAILVGGLGVLAGGYTSIQNFIAQIEHFDYFAKCYQCE